MVGWDSLSKKIDRNFYRRQRLMRTFAELHNIMRYFFLLFKSVLKKLISIDSNYILKLLNSSHFQAIFIAKTINDIFCLTIDIEELIMYWEYCTNINKTYLKGLVQIMNTSNYIIKRFTFFFLSNFIYFSIWKLPTSIKEIINIA